MSVPPYTTGESSYLWVCPKCATTNREDLIFCLNCATLESLPDDQVTIEAKIGKISETLGKAIEWSLQNAAFKPAEVVEQATKQGFRVQSVAELQRYANLDLEKLANRFIGLNQTAATGAGFSAGLPGGLAAFATIPADIAAVIYFAMRCVSGIGQAYGFELENSPADSPKVAKILAFAFACQLETIVIGGRRFEIFQLASYFHTNGNLHSVPVIGCVIKQLAAYLTRDFARTTWATFLPVVGGVINGIDNFWYVREVAKRSKLFYSGLLTRYRPAFAAQPEKVATSSLVTTPPIFELPGYSLTLPSGPLEVELLYTEQVNAVPLVVVLWPGATGRYVAEQLAEKGFAALLPPADLTPAILTELLQTLAQERPAFFPPDIRYKKAGLLAADDLATVALQANLQAAAVPVLFNPTGPAQSVTVSVPVLLHWSEGIATLDPKWLETVRPDGETGLLSISTNPATALDFLNPAAPGYHKQAATWAWSDSLAWLEVLR